MLSVFGTQLVPFQTQIPPPAAPRMRVPSWRIASAPTRPLTRMTVPESRVGCLRPLGPIGDHASANVVGVEGERLRRCPSFLPWSAA